MSWADVAAALRAYAPRRLIMGAFQYEGECCAVGAVAPTMRRHDGSRALPVEEFFADRDATCASLGIDAGDVQSLINENDSVEAETPEQRYARVLAWVDAQAAVAP